MMGKVGQQLEQHCVRESSSTDLTTRHTPADHSMYYVCNVCCRNLPKA